MDAINTLLGLALNAFALFVQLVVSVLSFFLTFFTMILTALHLQ